MIRVEGERLYVSGPATLATAARLLEESDGVGCGTSSASRPSDPRGIGNGSPASTPSGPRRANSTGFRR